MIGFDHIHYDMRITCALSISILPIALLAACSTPEPAPTPTPAPPQTVAPPPAPAPAPEPAGSWIDWPLAEGDWVYRSDDRGSLALFGRPGSDATFIIRCALGSNMIFLSQKGSATNGGQMTLRASSGLKAFPTRDTGGSLPYTAVALQPDEYMLDRIAFSRGRFAVQATGLTSLAIPIWPEFTRVVEDCRG